MRIYEDFTRCECGCASLIKDVITYATYKKHSNGTISHFAELIDRKETRYACEGCGKIIHIVKG